MTFFPEMLFASSISNKNPSTWQCPVTYVSGSDSVNSIQYTYCMYLLRDSVVGIVTGYGLDDREVGVRVPVG
jgi:hypothetical protein